MVQETDGLVHRIVDRLREMTAIDALAGHEQPMVRYLKERLEGRCDSVEVDAVGNLYAIRRGPQAGPTVMVAAHTDEIGLMVKSVDADGFLRFEQVGGVPDNLLAARVVRVKGQMGIIGVRAGHYQSPDERLRAPAPQQLYIDIGAQSAAEVAERGINIGDPIAFVSPLVELGGDRKLVAGKAVDNRLGCAILSLLVEEVTPSAGEFVAVFPVQEEVGLKGAGVAAERVRPHLAIALDTMPSGDTPDMDLVSELSARIGHGPCLQVLAGPRGKGFLTPAPVKQFVIDMAADAGVRLQVVTFTGGNNDAASMAWAGTGTPAYALCLPRRYSHSPVEAADPADAAGAYQLLAATVGRMGDLPSFAFLDSGEA